MNRAPTWVRPAANRMQPGRHAVSTLPDASVSVGRLGRTASKGKPETGGLAGGIFRSRVSAIRSLVRVFRRRRRFGKSVLCPPSSMQSPYQSAVIIHSALHSVLNAVLHCGHRYDRRSSGHLRPPGDAPAHGRDGNHVPTSRQTLKRKPETGGSAGKFVSGLGSRPSGPRFRCSGSGAGSGNPSSVICHRFSPLFYPFPCPSFLPFLALFLSVRSFP